MTGPQNKKPSNLPEFDLHGSMWSTFGHNDSGKSYLNEWLMIRAAESGRTVAIFDPMQEYPHDHQNIFRVVPNSRRGDAAVRDLGDFLDWVEYNKGDIDYILIDEVSRFHNARAALDGPVGEVVDLRAHWNMGVGMIARRPTQTHTDIRELADYTILFRLQGRTDIDRLNKWVDGLGTDVSGLPDYHFIVVQPSGSYREFQPI